MWKIFGWKFPIIFTDILLDAFIVMPNHIHGILIIDKPDCPGGCRDAQIGRPYGGNPTIILDIPNLSVLDLPGFENLAGLEISKSHPSGMKIFLSGMTVDPPGIKILPIGMKVDPPGMKISLIGMKVYPPGMKILPSGMKVDPPGMKVDPPGMTLFCLT